MHELGMISATAASVNPEEKSELPLSVTQMATKKCGDLGGDALLAAHTQISFSGANHWRDYVHLIATCVKTEEKQ